MKKHILDSITIDKFSQYSNGDLVKIFYDNDIIISDDMINKYNDSNCIYEYIMLNIVDINDETKPIDYFYNKVKVILNGRWLGITENPIELYKQLKYKKYKGKISKSTRFTSKRFKKIS